MAKISLQGLLQGSALRRMAGGRSFERGQDYMEDGRVSSLIEEADE
jgi:uncharacterized Zn finger protein